MPFTIAHAAIVLPLVKSHTRYVSSTALVIGSMAPDFEYFFKMRVNSSHSHSLWGLFYFDIPATILMAVVFHELIKKNLIDNLPLFFQARLQTLRHSAFIQYLIENPGWFILSAAIASLSHIVWDNFTHENGFFVHRLSFYSTVVPFDGVRYPMFYALQYISTAIGLIVLLVYFVFQKPAISTPLTKPNGIYWIAVFLITSAVITLRFVVDPDGLNLGNFVVSLMTAGATGLVLAGFLKFKRRRANQ